MANELKDKGRIIVILQLPLPASPPQTDMNVHQWPLDLARSRRDNTCPCPEVKTDQEFPPNYAGKVFDTRTVTSAGLSYLN